MDSVLRVRRNGSVLIIWLGLRVPTATCRVLEKRQKRRTVKFFDGAPTSDEG